MYTIQNQEAFIFVIINYKLPVFPLCLLCKIAIIFLKKATLRIKYIVSTLPADRPYFSTVLPVDQKVSLVSPKVTEDLLPFNFTKVVLFRSSHTEVFLEKVVLIALHF